MQPWPRPFPPIAQSHLWETVPKNRHRPVAWAPCWQRMRQRTPQALLPLHQLLVFLYFKKTSIWWLILQVCLPSGRVGGWQAPVHCWGFPRGPGETGEYISVASYPRSQVSPHRSFRKHSAGGPHWTLLTSSQYATCTRYVMALQPRISSSKLLHV